MKPESARTPMTAPYQSKLIPHEEFIRQCRVKRWSYSRIATALREKHGVTVGATTIFDFVKVRATKREVFALPPKAVSPQPISDLTNPADGFFEPAPAQPKKKDETKRLKYNLDL